MTIDKKACPLERTEELFQFLQGNVPDGYFIKRRKHPKLTPDQAWTVIWFIQSQYFEFPDFIERCDVCGNLYNSEAEGDCLDYGNSPYHFCDNCISSDAYRKKMRRNPDKAVREEYFRE